MDPPKPEGAGELLAYNLEGQEITIAVAHFQIFSLEENSLTSEEGGLLTIAGTSWIEAWASSEMMNLMATQRGESV